MSEYSKILVVDDEPCLREKFEEHLTDLGFLVVCIDPRRLEIDELVAQITTHHDAKVVFLDAMISSRFDGGDVYIKLDESWRQRVIAISEYLCNYIMTAGGKNYPKDFFGYKRHSLSVFQTKLEEFFLDPSIRERYSL